MSMRRISCEEIIATSSCGRRGGKLDDDIGAALAPGLTIKVVGTDEHKTVPCGRDGSLGAAARAEGIPKPDEGIKGVWRGNAGVNLVVKREGGALIAYLSLTACTKGVSRPSYGLLEDELVGFEPKKSMSKRCLELCKYTCSTKETPVLTRISLGCLMKSGGRRTADRQAGSGPSRGGSQTDAK